MRDYVLFVSLALFWVYEQRNGRWTGFIGALEGNYILTGSNKANGS